MLVASALISGLGLGSMYGLLALGFYITYSVSSTVNFSQGSSMMLGAVLAYTFAVTLGWPLWAAAALGLALCALYGIVVELAGIRPFAKRGSNAWLMATVAIGIVVDNMVLFTFGTGTNRWTPSGRYLDGLFNVTLEWPRFGSGALHVIKPRHGIHMNYRLDGPPGPMLGKLLFRPGSALPDATPMAT